MLEFIFRRSLPVMENPISACWWTSFESTSAMETLNVFRVRRIMALTTFRFSFNEWQKLSLNVILPMPMTILLSSLFPSVFRLPPSAFSLIHYTGISGLTSSR
jgi:hypothetical protein